MPYLPSLIREEIYMYWTRNMDNSNVIAEIFWTHPNSMKLLNMFHLVLIFLSCIQKKQVMHAPIASIFIYLILGWKLLIIYCTYKTNMYRLPLLEIIGVTSTKLTFSVVFSYMEHEREENFTWVLEKLKELSAFEKLLSKVLVTDLELLVGHHEEHPHWVNSNTQVRETPHIHPKL